MTTISAQDQLMLVLRHYANAAVQFSNVYNSEQAKLDLDRVLTPARLQDSDGTATSLAVLGQLRALTDAHNDAHGPFMIAFARDTSAAIGQLPQPQRDDERNGTIASLNRQLALQSDFYTNRERWIDTAEEICRLVERVREKTRFTDDEIIFDDDDDYDRFSELLAAVDQIHHLEVAAMQERMACIQRAMAVLSA
jgi:hypothetical protein